MSFETNGLTGLNGDAKQIIFAHKSRIGRLEERLADVEGERDRARGTGVELEQQIAAIQSGIDDLHRLYERREVDISPDPLDAARDVIVAVQDVLSLVTNTVLNDLIEEAEAAA
jgi:hypothetical protein